MYNSCIFDLYGTLIDIHTEKETLELWQTMSFHFQYSGIPITPEELADEFQEEINRQLTHPKIACQHPEIYIDETFAAIAAKRGAAPDPAWISETARWFRLLSMKRLTLYEGVLDTLHELKARGKKIYLLSNGQKLFVEAEMKLLGLSASFDGIAISSDAGICKPDPLFFDYLARTFRVDLSTALMIGNDATTDIAGAAMAGLDACYFHSNCSPETTEVDCKYQIWDGNFRRLLEWVL